MVRAAHGLLPEPGAGGGRAAARARPTYGVDVGVELTTPTGAALLAALAAGFGPLPPMTIEATGFGAGTRELDGRPNVDPGRDRRSGRTTLRPGQPVVLLEANVDDATGEMLAHTDRRAARRRAPTTRGSRRS